MKTPIALAEFLSEHSQKNIETFLAQVQTQVVERHDLKTQSVLISYVPEFSGASLSASTAQYLKDVLETLGFYVKASELDQVTALQSALNSTDFAIVLCTPDYATTIEHHPALREQLLAFGQKRADALHLLLCDSGSMEEEKRFHLVSTIVSGSFLARDFRKAFKVDNPLHAQACRLAVLFDISGTQGLGLLPNLLHLEHEMQQGAHQSYQALFEVFRLAQQNLSIDYKLGMGLVSETQHPLATHLELEHIALKNIAQDLQPTFHTLRRSSFELSFMRDNLTLIANNFRNLWFSPTLFFTPFDI